MRKTHGGNIYEAAEAARRNPADIIDFSASINPFAPPSGLEQNLFQNFSLVKSYPDINNTKIVHLLAETLNCSPYQIMVANGSTEIIYLLPTALGIRCALVVTPAFSEYENALHLAKSRVILAQASESRGFQPDSKLLSSCLDKLTVDAVFIANPNSPCGTLFDENTLDWLVFFCQSSGAFLIIDEVFIDFCESNSFKSLINSYKNILIIRSLTKFYGLAGIRLGYALGSPVLINSLKKFQPPWSVNILAQLAGIYCIQQEEFRYKTLKYIEKERSRFSQKINQVSGFSAFPSKANFILVKMAEGLPPSSHLQHFLLERGVLIRDCLSFSGMGDHFFRVCIKNPGENDQLVILLRRYMTLIGSINDSPHIFFNN